MMWMIGKRRIELGNMTDFERKNVAQQQLDKLTADHPEPEERLKALENVLGEKFWENKDLKFKASCL
jgi:hypothetical protein